MAGRLDIDKAKLSDYSAQAAYTVDIATTDGVSESGEVRWSNPHWNKYWGYFNNVGDLKSALLMKTVWDVGKGWTADNATTAILDSIVGWGNETFDDVLFNADLIRYINGDSYTHVIRNEDTGTLLNMKPLDPGVMSTIVGEDGMLKGFEQRSKVKGKKPKKFKTHQILHLVNNRLADQIHGISDIDALEKTILADQENFEDIQKLMHFQAKPFIIFKMKTDDEATIAKFVAKVEKGRKYSEDLFIPDDDNLLSWEVIQINPSQVIMEWRNQLKNKFYRQVGLPEIIFGTSGATESGGKMELFGHEQVFDNNQRYLERQLWAQCAIRIDLIAPTSLSQNLQNDEAKDAQQGLELQKSDVSTGGVK